MDIAPAYAGRDSALTNAAGAVAGIISPVVIGGLVDWTGNWSLAFSTSIAVLVFGLIATIMLGRRMASGTLARVEIVST